MSHVLWAQPAAGLVIRHILLFVLVLVVIGIEREGERERERGRADFKDKLCFGNTSRPTDRRMTLIDVPMCIWQVKPVGKYPTPDTSKYGAVAESQQQTHTATSGYCQLLPCSEVPKRLRD